MLVSVAILILDRLGPIPTHRVSSIQLYNNNNIYIYLFILSAHWYLIGRYLSSGIGIAEVRNVVGTCLPMSRSFLFEDKKYRHMN